MLQNYLNQIFKTSQRGDAREESYYGQLQDFLNAYAEQENLRKMDVTVLPKQTEAGNPDFRIWDGAHKVTGYIEAKAPTQRHLNQIAETEQLKRYRSTFPNLILTNFFEFRLYRNGELVDDVEIGDALVALSAKTKPPAKNQAALFSLLGKFFAFSQPHITTAPALAKELAKRTRFLRDEVIQVELEEEQKSGKKNILGFYEAFKTYLIASLTSEQFADLYSQTITYGLFAAKTRADTKFNRANAIKFIPPTIGILRDVFQFISLGQPPKSLEVIVDDIAAVLDATNTRDILQKYYQQHKGSDPIIHFYETFLEKYDPSIREKRGVYYTPEPVVHYIVNSLHQILKDKFDKADGFADPSVTVLDPAGGTLTFPVIAIQKAVEEFTTNYGSGGLNNFMQSHILKNFYAFELMMAPYAIGHLKMGFMLEELGYQLSNDERFKLYLTNTLEMEDLGQVNIPGISSLSEESHLAAEVKKNEPILVILGNPPYSGSSSNINDWTEKLLKEAVDGAQSYYEVDDQPLGEKNPKWLQDDYVKFLRFAQWKIQKAGQGVVGMITSHSYLDNPTFRGMRQSLMKTFDEIFILNLHGNSLKREKTPSGKDDKNVFDIRQGVSIVLMVKQTNHQPCKVHYYDKYGDRPTKYQWLKKHDISNTRWQNILPLSKLYLFIPQKRKQIKKYITFIGVPKIFPVNSVGIVTSRDHFVIDFDKEALTRRIERFLDKTTPVSLIEKAYNLHSKPGWDIETVRATLRKDLDWRKTLTPILYRPFDTRSLVYNDALLERSRRDVVSNMLQNNLSIILGRRMEIGGNWDRVFIADKVVQHHSMSLKEVNYVFPLYLYAPPKHRPRNFGTVLSLFEAEDPGWITRKPNINPEIWDKLEEAYEEKPTPEQLLFYIYAVLYSNTYRDKYTEFLRLDFPRVPFTGDYKLFLKLSNLGERLADLHLLKSRELTPPVARFEGSGSNDIIEKVTFDEAKQRVYINPNKYFAPVPPEVWNSQVGGYQVCHKYLKDRRSRKMDDAPRYCKIVTALAKTIEVQTEIDKLYPGVEKSLANF